MCSLDRVKGTEEIKEHNPHSNARFVPLRVGSLEQVDHGVFNFIPHALGFSLSIPRCLLRIIATLKRAPASRYVTTVKTIATTKYIFFFFHHLFSLSHFRDFQSAEPFNTVLYCLLFPILPQKAKLFDAQQSVKQIKQRLALAMSVHDINHIKCLRILF